MFRLQHYLVVSIAAIGVLHAQPFPAGQPIEKVTCQASPSHSYALYLPSNYTPEKKWPILYAFDPRKRGMIPLELFREGAEKHGYIIASSNDFMSDTPTLDDALEAMRGLWNDTTSRFSIDPKRIYSTGFSGGARFSWLFDDYIESFPFAGIIGVGGGLPSTEIQRWIHLGPVFFGLVGETDFNYYDMQDLAGLLDIEGIPNRLVSFPGGHQWPPAEQCTEALDWMQVQAMRKTLIPPESGFLEAYQEGERSRSKAAESEGRSADAYQTLLDLTQDLTGLMDLSEIQGDLERLVSSKAVRAQLNKRKKEARKADQSVQLGFRGLDRIRNASRDDLPPLRELLFEMRIRPLRKKAAGKDVEERLAAQRVLESLFVQLSFYLPRDFKRTKNYARARLSLQLAADIKPENPVVWYRLAQVESLSGSTQSALKSLQKALEKGFPRPELFHTDPELKAVRSLPGFQDMAGPSRP